MAAPSPAGAGPAGDGIIAIVTLFAVLEAQDQASAVLNAAAGWPTVLFALLDGMVAVSLSLWCIS